MNKLNAALTKEMKKMIRVKVALVLLRCMVSGFTRIKYFGIDNRGKKSFEDAINLLDSLIDGRNIANATEGLSFNNIDSLKLFESLELPYHISESMDLIKDNLNACLVIISKANHSSKDKRDISKYAKDFHTWLHNSSLTH
jgi:hypothetical protein